MVSLPPLMVALTPLIAASEAASELRLVSLPPWPLIVSESPWAGSVCLTKICSFQLPTERTIWTPLFGLVPLSVKVSPVLSAP